MKRLRLLILGGTSEASALARRLADEAGVAPILSLAGATANPAPAPIQQRIGGFGGAEGLASYLEAERIDALIDATHPFAARMSMNALAAARATQTPLVVFSRLPWAPQEGDRWIEVATMDDAAEALGSERKTVFLTQGRTQLAAFAKAPQHRYVVRAIDRPAGIDALPECKLILARGPFVLADELKLMRDERVETLVTKNSGGSATYAKIEAARTLGVGVVMVRRPKPPEAETLHDLDDVMAWIARVL
ncbi:MAG: cobalt-precorrin-6A reductase [Roseiarcus sp.]|uniref:cobalt-precorrin-6A reductase n=1 Tax=Roseiarcus sp. TaxID=1969460 RepID=UPI003C51F728